MTAAVTEDNGAGSASAVAGRVVRVIGPVVDVEFPRGAVPELFNALNAAREVFAAEETADG